MSCKCVFPLVFTAFSVCASANGIINNNNKFVTGDEARPAQ